MYQPYILIGGEANQRQKAAAEVRLMCEDDILNYSIQSVLQAWTHLKLGWMEADILQITERRKTELWMKIVARMRTVTWHSSSWSSDHSPRSIGPIVESILRTATQMLVSNATGWYLENVIVSIYCSIPGRHKYLRSAATIQSYPRTTDIYSCLQLSKHLRGHSTESLAPSTDFPLCILH